MPTPWKHWNLPPRSLIPAILDNQSFERRSAICSVWGVTGRSHTHYCSVDTAAGLQRLQHTVNISEERLMTETCNELLHSPTKTILDRCEGAGNTRDSWICDRTDVLTDFGPWPLVSAVIRSGVWSDHPWDAPFEIFNYTRHPCDWRLGRPRQSWEYSRQSRIFQHKYISPQLNIITRHRHTSVSIQFAVLQTRASGVGKCPNNPSMLHNAMEITSCLWVV